MEDISDNQKRRIADDACKIIGSNAAFFDVRQKLAELGIKLHSQSTLDKTLQARLHKNVHTIPSMILFPPLLGSPFRLAFYDDTLDALTITQNLYELLAHLVLGHKGASVQNDAEAAYFVRCLVSLISSSQCGSFLPATHISRRQRGSVYIIDEKTTEVKL